MARRLAQHGSTATFPVTNDVYPILWAHPGQATCLVTVGAGQDGQWAWWVSDLGTPPTVPEIETLRDWAICADEQELDDYPASLLDLGERRLLVFTMAGQALEIDHQERRPVIIARLSSAVAQTSDGWAGGTTAIDNELLMRDYNGGIALVHLSGRTSFPCQRRDIRARREPPAHRNVLRANTLESWSVTNGWPSSWRRPRGSTGESIGLCVSRGLLSRVTVADRRHGGAARARLGRCARTVRAVSPASQPSARLPE